MKKKIRIAMTFLLAMLTAVAVGSAAAWAAPNVPLEMTIYRTSDMTRSSINMDGVKNESAVTKLKSSNEAVVTASTSTREGTVYIDLVPKKKGKAVVSFKYKFKGRTRSAKVRVTVFKYRNPFSSLKIGSANYASRFNKRPDWTCGKNKLSGKISVEPKKNWRLTAIEIYRLKDGRKIRIPENNTRVTVKKGFGITILLQNKKNSRYMTTCLAVGN